MPTRTLHERTWRPLRLAHEARVATWLAPYLERRSRGIGHPVEDFLFTYYAFSPAALQRWHPGIGVRLTGDVSYLREIAGYDVQARSARLRSGLATERAAQVSSIRRLLSATRDRPLVLGCFGLHEWAMVYRQTPETRRHPAYPLRLGARGTDEVIESHRVNCTHYDAFRFFTPAARPRNSQQPTRAAQPEHEQPGCLHVTMDLYKWAYQLSPFTSAELVADCFQLAWDVRRVDMQASPYDLSALDVPPIAIETVAGKTEYVAAQRRFAELGKSLRSRLIATCDQVLLTGLQGQERGPGDLVTGQEPGGYGEEQDDNNGDAEAGLGQARVDHSGAGSGVG